MRTLEHVDRRVLGAIAFRDRATRLGISQPLRVESSGGVQLIRNKSGLYVVAGAQGLEDHTAAFESPPIAPPAGSIELEMKATDPRGRYLARRFVVRLPRDPDPAAAGAESSLFQPVGVDMFLSPTAPVAPAWAVVRVSVFEEGDPDHRLAGALIRVVRKSNSEHLASGMTDSRGESLVAIPGVSLTNYSESDGDDPAEPAGANGPVTAAEIAVSVEVYFDPGSEDQDAPDPDALEARRQLEAQDVPVAPGGPVTRRRNRLRSHKQDEQIASGRSLKRNMFVALA